MRFVTYSTAQQAQARLGIIVAGDTVVDLQKALAGKIEIPDTLLEYIQAGKELHARVLAEVNTTTEYPAEVSESFATVNVHMPFRPGKVIGVGLNYIEHVEESSRTLDTDKDRPTRPVLFSKPGTAVVGPNQPIRHNAKLTEQLDWECELAVVMGTSALDVKEGQALDYVFGYSILTTSVLVTSVDQGSGSSPRAKTVTHRSGQSLSPQTKSLIHRLCSCLSPLMVTSARTATASTCSSKLRPSLKTSPPV